MFKVEKVEQKLITTLYTNETDRNNLIQWNSFHAPHTFKGIPKGQFIRARKICSEDHDYHNQKDKLIRKFTVKGYEKQQLKEVGEEIGKCNRGFSSTQCETQSEQERRD